MVVQPRTGVKEYTEQEQRLLGTLDLDLERQAKGASLAQLAETGNNNIEVRGVSLCEGRGLGCFVWCSGNRMTT